MNLSLLAADLARRIPAMAQDSASNNEQLIQGMLEQAGIGELSKDKRRMDWLSVNSPRFYYDSKLPLRGRIDHAMESLSKCAI